MPRRTAQSATPPTPDALGAMERVFGFHAFRPNQEPIVQALLAGRDVFAVMPTGGGKSLCYQLPACILPGTCVVISPLISLMKDQVDAACANGIAAEYLNSSLDAPARGEVFRRLMQGQLDLLYVSPERFAMSEFVAALRQVPLCLFAIDEAHCISEWGHQFRPDYLSLARIAREFPDVPIAAFTATATAQVQDDILSRLQLRQPLVVRASFDRPNLYYQVQPKNSVHDQLIRFLQDRPSESGIVYRTTRKSVDETAAQLAHAGLRAAAYHAGLLDEERHQVQEDFSRDRVQVVVATIAFGMGIDKSNVRFVVHADLPRNMESYYQETGRAGRDGAPAHCLLLHAPGDVARLRYFVDQIEDDAERQIAERKLRQMASFATVCACRRRQVLGYFGEEYASDDCGACDVCADDIERVNATTDAQMVMSAIVRTGERFGATHVVDVLWGADTEKIRQYGHDKVKTYGIGREQPKRHWRQIIDDLLAQERLVEEGGQYPGLRLTPSGREVLFGRQPFHVLKRARTRPKRPRAGSVSVPRADEGLFDHLRALRRRLAEERNVPPYVVFSDKTLQEMAARTPSTIEEFGDITGVGQRKLDWYGEDFLAAIREYTGRT